MLELIGNFEFDNQLFFMFKKQNTIRKENQIEYRRIYTNK